MYLVELMRVKICKQKKEILQFKDSGDVIAMCPKATWRHVYTTQTTQQRKVVEGMIYLLLRLCPFCQTRANGVGFV